MANEPSMAERLEQLAEARRLVELAAARINWISSMKRAR